MFPLSLRKFSPKITFYFMAALVLLLAVPTHAAAKLRIGVTLHPYYSYVANVVGKRAEVVPIIQAGFNPHAYEPRAQDIKLIGNLDVVVLNDIGHDDFARKMIAASEKPNVAVIKANANVPLLSGIAIGAPGGRAVNAHTFLSITAAMLQVNTIAKELGKIDPPNADFYRQNARAYNRRLRQLRAKYLGKLKSGASVANFNVATEHGAYDYLLREFGMSVSAVIEPAHGIEPSPSQLKKVVDMIVAKNIKVLFSEQDNPSTYIKTLMGETGLKAYPLTHITHGKYSADKFEKGMEQNLKIIVRAILENGS